MKQNPSIEKLDAAILYNLEPTLSVLLILLVLGSITSMANASTDREVLIRDSIMNVA